MVNLEDPFLVISKMTLKTQTMRVKIVAKVIFDVSAGRRAARAAVGAGVAPAHDVQARLHCAHHHQPR